MDACGGGGGAGPGGGGGGAGGSVGKKEGMEEAYKHVKEHLQSRDPNAIGLPVSSHVIAASSFLAASICLRSCCFLSSFSRARRIALCISSS